MKRIALYLGIVVAVLLLAAISLPFLIDANQFRPRVEAELTKALARSVTVGSLSLSILSGGVTADDLAVADNPAYSRAPFLHTKSLTLGVEMWPLLTSRKLNVTRLAIDQPEINLIQSAAGDWNFSTLGGKSKPAAPSAPGAGMNMAIKLIKITGGRLSLAQANSSARPRVLEKMDIELRDFSSTTVFPFTLSAKLAGGGDLKLDGNAGPINAADAAQTPAKVRVKLAGFDLAAAGVGTSSGLAGMLSLDGAAATNGAALFLNGRVKADQLKLAKNGSPARQPVAFDFALEHDLRKHSGVLRRGDIHIGNAPASLTGTYAQHGEATVLNMNLSGPSMPVPDLAAMLPALGVVLPAGSSFQGGTANVKLSFAGPAESPVVTGSVGMDNTRLTGFDLGSKMSTIQKLAGIHTGPNTEIQTFSTNLRVAPEGTTAQDIKLVAPSLGELTGAGTISPTHALNFKMHALLHTSGGVMAVLGQSGDTGVPFGIEGTAADPVFRPDVAGMASEQLKNLQKTDAGKAAAGLLEGLFGQKPKK